MTVGWIAYVLAVSALVTLAARAAEAALRPRRPLRWVWAAGLAATAAAPLAPRLIPLVAGRGATGASTAGAASGPGVLADGAPAAPGADAGPEALVAVVEVLATPVPDGLAAGLGAAWGAASLVLLAMMIGGWIRLQRRCRSWPEGRAAGEAVRVSRETGPAAAGLLRPVVIVPATLLGGDGEDVRMAVLHEREHARARDPALLAAGRALAALVPWNPLVWWQLGRLRLAVELDCDRRVLERGVPRRGYGRLLLEVSAAPSGGLLRPAATLGERPTHLEERIRAMTSEPAARPSVLRSVLLVGLALGLLAGACETPAPPSPGDGGADTPEAAADRAAGDEGEEASDARDLDRKPEVRDRREVTRALARAYPQTLRDEGVGGAVTLRLRVGPDGTVERARVLESSGHPKLDVVVKDALASVEFEPATRDGEPVAAWFTQRVTFAVHPDDGGDGTAGGEGDAAPSASGIVVGADVPADAKAAGPTFRIRGDAPLDTDTQPLIVLDGERVTGTAEQLVGDAPAPARIRDLDPDDIESIRVLKGEEAVAAYGEDADSGVLLIETKDRSRGSG